MGHSRPTGWSPRCSYSRSSCSPCALRCSPRGLCRRSCRGSSRPPAGSAAATSRRRSRRTATTSSPLSAPSSTRCPAALRPSRRAPPRAGPRAPLDPQHRRGVRVEPRSGALLQLALQTAIDATVADRGRIKAREHAAGPLTEVARVGSLDRLEGSRPLRAGSAGHRRHRRSLGGGCERGDGGARFDRARRPDPWPDHRLPDRSRVH